MHVHMYPDMGLGGSWESHIISGTWAAGALQLSRPSEGTLIDTRGLLFWFSAQLCFHFTFINISLCAFLWVPREELFALGSNNDVLFIDSYCLVMSLTLNVISTFWVVQRVQPMHVLQPWNSYTGTGWHKKAESSFEIIYSQAFENALWTCVLIWMSQGHPHFDTREMVCLLTLTLFQLAFLSPRGPV